MNAYKNEINSLSKLKLNKLDLKIPEASINEKVEQEGKKALATLIVAIPILIAMIAINTLFLKEVFTLFGIKGNLLIKPFILKASEVLALVFCVIEVSVGYFFGVKAYDKEHIFKNENDEHEFSKFIEKSSHAFS